MRRLDRGRLDKIARKVADLEARRRPQDLAQARQFFWLMVGLTPGFCGQERAAQLAEQGAPMSWPPCEPTEVLA